MLTEVTFIAGYFLFLRNKDCDANVDIFANFGQFVENSTILTKQPIKPSDYVN